MYQSTHPSHGDAYSLLLHLVCVLRFPTFQKLHVSYFVVYYQFNKENIIHIKDSFAVCVSRFKYFQYTSQTCLEFIVCMHFD